MLDKKIATEIGDLVKLNQKRKLGSTPTPRFACFSLYFEKNALQSNKNHLSQYRTLACTLLDEKIGIEIGDLIKLSQKRQLRSTSSTSLTCHSLYFEEDAPEGNKNHLFHYKTLACTLLEEKIVTKIGHLLKLSKKHQLRSTISTSRICHSQYFEENGPETNKNHLFQYKTLPCILLNKKITTKIGDLIRLSQKLQLRSTLSLRTACLSLHLKESAPKTNKIHLSRCRIIPCTLLC